MVKAMIALFGFGLAALISWLAWGPALHFLFSLIPATAAYAWVGKLICVAVIAWGGGIALPLAMVGLTMAALLR